MGLFLLGVITAGGFISDNMDSWIHRVVPASVLSGLMHGSHALDEAYWGFSDFMHWFLIYVAFTGTCVAIVWCLAMLRRGIQENEAFPKEERYRSTFLLALWAGFSVWTLSYAPMCQGSKLHALMRTSFFVLGALALLRLLYLVALGNSAANKSLPTSYRQPIGARKRGTIADPALRIFARSPRMWSAALVIGLVAQANSLWRYSSHFGLQSGESGMYISDKLTGRREFKSDEQCDPE